jgi:hypothetical protein
MAQSLGSTENYYINTKPALRAAANARKVRLENEEAKLGEVATGDSVEAENGPNEKL